VEQREKYFWCSSGVKKDVVTRETQKYAKNRANLIYVNLRSVINVSKPTEELISI
jgi:hypothetical protein